MRRVSEALYALTGKSISVWHYKPKYRAQKQTGKDKKKPLISERLIIKISIGFYYNLDMQIQFC